MYKFVFGILSLLFYSFNSFSQLSYFPVLIGHDDKEIISYLDSLNHLKSNPYYLVKRTVSDNGSLILRNDFSISDEPYYTCSGVWAKFVRVEGEELCVKHSLLGSAEYVYKNLNYIKDNFKQVDNNTWERIYTEDGIYKIVATLQIKGGEYRTYIITYELLRTDK